MLPISVAVLHEGSQDPTDPIKGGIVSIFLERPPNFGKRRGGFHPGQVAWIRVPSVNKHQWHPFTIASGARGQIRFCIQALGDWTTELCRQISKSPGHSGTTPAEGVKVKRSMRPSMTLGPGDDGDFTTAKMFNNALGMRVDEIEEKGVVGKSVGVHFPDMLMSIDGPFRAPTVTATESLFKSKDGGGVICVFVASGIGITPFIAMIDAVIEAIELEREDRMLHPDTQIHLYWMTRRADDFLLMLPAFQRMQANKKILKHMYLHLHLTRLDADMEANNCAFMFRWGVQLHNELLRAHLHENDHRVPFCWLYKKPLDILGLRYLATNEEEDQIPKWDSKFSAVTKYMFYFFSIMVDPFLN